jgi:aspartate aminotransferase
MTTGSTPPVPVRAAIRDLQPSLTLQINDRVRQLRASGQQIYHLGFGESRFPVHVLIAQALRENAQRRSYQPLLGMPALRQTIGAYYQSKFGWEVDAEQVVVGPGSKALLYAIMLALTGEVVLPTPTWVSYAPQVELTGRSFSYVPMDGAQGYRLDAESIRAYLDRKGGPTTLLYSNPHNPTGTVMTSLEVQALAALAQERALTVLSDEIYMLTTHADTPPVSVYDHYPQGTVVTGGLSKHLSVGGWRFGVAILPPGAPGRALADALHNLAGAIWSCVAAPVQHAALVAYSGAVEIERYIRDCTRMHAVRTRYLYDALREFGVSLPELEGGFYLYPSFARWKSPLAKRGVQNSVDLAYRLLEDYQIVALPGSAFGDDPGELTLRFSTSFLDVGTDEQAAGIVAAFEDDPDPERFIQNYHPETRTVVERFADFIGSLERSS